ncbi:hypothetical protein [Amycolatopsis alkalitolerans]|uniref:Uncharacterized protein n=1 Tax=Amycolatopsis alkalitolerans TaxID=2547244 RepID=A0A5C4LQG7_9PSEU|nr:hypothetical protein [Amycolatopsis alkalitolerans]TNC20197.1 hypothetical protein FG385_31250 [Amycolatopsis alkalitolerans]
MDRSIARRVVIALLAVCCALLVAAPAAAAAPKTKVTLHANAAQQQVKVGQKLKVRGTLDVAARSGGGAEPVVVQSLQAGAWVDLTTGRCRPDGGFTLDLSFAVSAQFTLRVYHPETTLYASAASNVFAVLVL